MLDYYQNFLSPQESAQLMNWLDASEEVNWQSETFRIYGREVTAPRTLTWFGDAGLNYRYTGCDHFTHGWPEPLQRIRQKVHALSGLTFNFVLLNRYQSGAQYMGWHKDDERGAAATIASLSLGASRRFRVDSNTSGERETLQLEDGSLLVFDGRQRHCLPATKRCDLPRINLTFRRIQA
tara:strand:+ start:1038 stop:1577 length:540 start_codon:yes stop_codon:yes gene_type:complete